MDRRLDRPAGGRRSVESSDHRRVLARSNLNSTRHNTDLPGTTTGRTRAAAAGARAADRQPPDDGLLREQVWAVRGEPRGPESGRGKHPFNCLLSAASCYGPSKLSPNPNPKSQTRNHNHTQVELGAEASALFLAIFLPLYMVAHWRDWLPRVYSSRRFLFPKQTLPHETPPHRRHLLSWLTDSWPVGDKDILRYYGLDALLFLRSIRLQSLGRLCGYSSFWGGFWPTTYLRSTPSTPLTHPIPAVHII